jgi:hypothetical protein
MVIAFRITNDDLWKNVTAYFLGPNLNQMPAAIIPAQYHIENPFAAPLVPIDSPHTLLVALAYSVIFLVVALSLTGKRDVKE